MDGQCLDCRNVYKGLRYTCLLGLKSGLTVCAHSFSSHSNKADRYEPQSHMFSRSQTIPNTPFDKRSSHKHTPGHNSYQISPTIYSLNAETHVCFHDHCHPRLQPRLRPQVQPQVQPQAYP